MLSNRFPPKKKPHEGALRQTRLPPVLHDHRRSQNIWKFQQSLSIKKESGLLLHTPILWNAIEVVNANMWILKQSKDLCDDNDSKFAMNLHRPSVSFVLIGANTDTRYAVPFLRKSVPLNKRVREKQKTVERKWSTSGEIRTLGSVPLLSSDDLLSAISMSTTGSLEKESETKFSTHQRKN